MQHVSEYQSVAARAKAEGVTRQTMYARIRKGQITVCDLDGRMVIPVCPKGGQCAVESKTPPD